MKKDKTSIKKELEQALLNKEVITYSSLAKKVGISTYRVKKYCESRHIDLTSYNDEQINNKPVKKELTKNKKINLKNNKDKIKINIYTEKIVLD